MNREQLMDLRLQAAFREHRDTVDRWAAVHINTLALVNSLKAYGWTESECLLAVQECFRSVLANLARAEAAE